ncbi:C58 family peptidase [Myxococcus sp. K15C18031901]|uniref:C58 family peptidase n=1 Tax=Myxococcus dinghuensis TaxID=2906761 RepID=UPI0020A7CF13|nr:C58 family peptidase [Myxococcus dinghuensis]MCP3099609.1 C58 family peptidase [Myxococcus dinghuensis]
MPPTIGPKPGALPPRVPGNTSPTTPSSSSKLPESSTATKPLSPTSTSTGAPPPAKQDVYAGQKPAPGAGTPQLGDTLAHPTKALHEASLSKSNVAPQDLQQFQAEAKTLRESLRSGIKPSGHIQKICDSIQRDVPNAAVLHYIDQSSNEIMQSEAARTGFSEGSQGVCNQMTNQWINLHASSQDPKAATRQFSELVEHKFVNLVIGQHDEAERTKQNDQAVRALRSQADTCIAEAKTANAKVLELQTKMKAGATLTPAEVSEFKTQDALVDSKFDEAKALVARMEKMKELPGTVVFQGDANQLASHLKSGPLADGFYRLEMTPKKAQDGDDSGHVLGLHKSGGTCGLMDPNTAHWQVPSQEDLGALTMSHVKQLYKPGIFGNTGSGFAASQYALRLMPAGQPPGSNTTPTS